MAKWNHCLTEWLTALVIWGDKCMSACHSTLHCWAGTALVAPFFSLFQPFPFNLSFFLLSFPGSVAIATVSFDHPAFLPSGLPLSASDQWGFTHLRNSPLKLLFQHAYNNLGYSSVEASLDIASGATRLAPHFVLHSGTVFCVICLQQAALELLSQNHRYLSVICRQWYSMVDTIFWFLQCLHLSSFNKPRLLFSEVTYLWVWFVEHLSLEKHLPFQCMLWRSNRNYHFPALKISSSYLNLIWPSCSPVLVHQS